jgi:formimidoylglutamate deiminase
MKLFKFEGLLQSTGWMIPAYVGVDASGAIQYLSDACPAEATAIEHVSGYALPGFQNAHSHAFQYAMAGMAEKHAPGSADDFWSWREAMYLCALSMDPDQVEAVATMLYAEMLKKGYTHVAEFHYLHHDKGGKPYANLSEMGERHLIAAKKSGIKITLIPILYQQAGFGKESHERQRRFISKDLDSYFHLLDDTAHAVSNYRGAKLGFGVHSLRAVSSDAVIKTLREGPPEIPFHLHAAEQLQEVKDCVDYLNVRPIEWLLNNLPVDNRFHIVHCTHMNDSEVKGLAKSKAHVVLCPGTEGNLGDGIFRLTDYHQNNGHWSIGTDSHISLNPLEDLRWLDYAQRFTTHKRNTFDDGADVLFNETLFSGRRAMGSSTDKYFDIGDPLDAVVYDSQSSLLSRHAGHLLQSLIYTMDSAGVLGTLSDGRWVVKHGVHVDQDQILKAFRAAISAI